MSDDFSGNILNRQDMDDLYSLIKEKNEPLFFDYMVNYICKKKGEDGNFREIEQELKPLLEKDERFIGFSDYYWFLSEAVTDRTLVPEGDLRKLELYILKTKEPVFLSDILLTFNKEGDDAFKSCLRYSLHEDPRFLLIDSDLWYLKSEVPKRVFRTPSVSEETYPEPVSIADLAVPLNEILRDVEEVSSKDNPKTFRTKPPPMRYALTDVDISVGGIKIMSTMRDYFPDHPMILKIRVCGRFREYNAYLNNRTGYIRGLEDWGKDSELSKGEVILITPLNYEKREYRFFSRGEKNFVPNENWKLKEFKKLKEIYSCYPLSLTNLVLQAARIFCDVEVHFDSIYDVIMSIRPTGKDTVTTILEQLPFSYRISPSGDFWGFDENKFNKFLIMGLSSMIGDFSAGQIKDKKQVFSPEKVAETEISENKDEKIKKLEKDLQSKENQIKDASSKVEAFEKLAEVRAQQINTLTQSSKNLEKQITKLREELEKAKKSSSDTIELKKMQQRMMTLQELIKNKKKHFMKLEQEKSQLEKALLEMDGLTAKLEKEKNDYLSQLEATKKQLEEKAKAVTEKNKSMVSQETSQSGKISELKSKLEKLEKELADNATRFAKQEYEIKLHREELEQKEVEILELKGRLEEVKKPEELEPGGPPVPVFDLELAGEYEEKPSEKDERLIEAEKRIAEFEKLKLDLEEKVRSQKTTISNMTALISEKENIAKEKESAVKEKEAIIKEKEELLAKLRKDLEEASSRSSEEEKSRGEEVEDLKERVDVLEKELESKTNLYNTNLNMQFTLNKDIYRLQKKSDFLKEVILFLFENLPHIPDKENLDSIRIKELMAMMSGEEMEEDTDIIRCFEIFEDTFDRINGIIKEIEDSNNLYREEIEIYKGFRDRFEEEKKISDEQRHILDKQKEEIKAIEYTIQTVHGQKEQLKQELLQLSGNFLIGGKVKKILDKFF